MACPCSSTTPDGPGPDLNVAAIDFLARGGDYLPRRSRRATWGSWSEAWSANSALTCTGS
jgi:hypothetical protein